MSDSARTELRAGTIAAFSAFGIWAMIPLYFKAVGVVGPGEILAHRIAWSIVFLAPLLLRRGQIREMVTTFRVPRHCLWLVIGSVLLGFNWFLFIFAVATDRVLDSSLGYFINPLVFVLLALVVLGEKLSRVRWTAVTIAGLAVANLVWQHGSVPWLALGLAASFALYGLSKKFVPISSQGGLFIESLLMLPAALAYLIWLEIVGRGHFLASGSSLTLNGLIILSGVVTVIPLAMFAFGARRIPLATIGLAQYITPSGQFLLAVFVFGETFDRARLVSFGLIWIALALYSWDLLVRRAPAKVTPAHST